ncbi:unnamed protein product [Echinostoma caproni]|uniref:Uncharacterized protein n=1 Tax=Echinostoma caproni TaxID=27848 RepID=A0A3P8GXX6_9TREM|nr:unnamed protein product [Echinostoma caproni]
MWKCTFGHRYPGQMQKPPITQNYTITSAPAELPPSTTSTSTHHASRCPSITTNVGLAQGAPGPGPTFLSPRLGEDSGYNQASRSAHRSITTEPFYPVEQQTDSGKSHTRHARRTMRRCGWRSGDRTAGRGGTNGGPGDLVVAATASGAPSKSVTRSHNLAERDPQAFFRILSDKLQRVLDNQLATERLDQLMTEVCMHVCISNIFQLGLKMHAVHGLG